MIIDSPNDTFFLILPKMICIYREGIGALEYLVSIFLTDWSKENKDRSKSMNRGLIQGN